MDNANALRGISMDVMDCPNVLPPSSSSQFQIDTSQTIILSPLLFQFKASSINSSKPLQIALENTWLLREDPTFSSSNIGDS